MSAPKPKLEIGPVGVAWEVVGRPKEIRTVDGWFIPPRETALFAVTPSEGIGDGYRVTHIPSGYYAVSSNNKAKAIAIMRQLSALLQSDPFWREAAGINSEALHAWKDEHPAEWTEIKRITGRSTNS